MTAGVAGIGNSANARHPVRAGNPDGPREETSLIAFASILLVHRRSIALLALIGTVIAGAFASTESTLYVSRASFVVKGARAPVQLPGGAGALGLSLSAFAEFSQSVSFYADLGRAMTTLKRIAADQYSTSASPGVKRPLPQVLGIKEKDPKRAIELAAQRLAPNVSYSISSRTGVVRLSVASVDPLLAQQLASSILAELDRWSKDSGHRAAVQERQFVEELVADARSQLATAEQAERNFLETNRQYASSPELRLEYNRLNREVSTRQEIYTSLAQTYEQARIEENRIPTVLSIVETADLPVEPQRREALRKTLIGLCAGALVGIVLAVLRQRADEKHSLA